MRKLLIAILIIFSGCGTFLGTGSEGLAPYQGIHTDAMIVRETFSGRGSSSGYVPEPTVFFGIISILDLPLSWALDTAMLPISLPYYYSK